MYGFVKGTIDYIKPGYVCVDTGNVGYLLNISDKTFDFLQGETDEIKLYTYMNVKEDDISLFGFLSVEELDFFKMLISVNSIGPKSGLSLLSFYSVNELKALILNKDAKAISKTPGVGAKSAEKIIIELKDKITDFETTEDLFVASKEDDETVSDCVDALVSLGFKKKDALLAVKKVSDYTDLSDLLSKALLYFEK